MSDALLIATMFAAYSTMFIMTYISFYIYDCKRTINGSNRESYVEGQQGERVFLSSVWPVTIGAVIGMNLGSWIFYIFGNFFNILDTIGSKIAK